MSDLKATGRSGPVDMALQALSLLASEGAMGVREIARRCNAPSSSIGRALVSLRSAGFVEFASDTQRYSLGPATAWLGDAYLKKSDLVQRAYPVMQAVFGKIGETISLHARRGAVRVPITQIESTNSLRWAPQMGRTYALHAGAASKVLLAYASEDEIETVLAEPLEAYTPGTETDPTKLRKELARIRARGYAIGLGERDVGAVGMAAPIFDASHVAVACLTVAGPERRLTKSLLERVVIPELLRAAAEISGRLGFINDSAPGGLRRQPTIAYENRVPPR